MVGLFGLFLFASILFCDMSLVPAIIITPSCLTCLVCARAWSIRSSIVAPGWFRTLTNASRRNSVSSMQFSILSPTISTCFFAKCFLLCVGVVGAVLEADGAIVITAFEGVDDVGIITVGVSVAIFADAVDFDGILSA